MKQVTVFIKGKTIKGLFSRWGSSVVPKRCILGTDEVFLPEGWYDVLRCTTYRVLLAWNLSKKVNGRPLNYQPSVKYLYWSKKEAVWDDEIKW